MRFEIIIEFSPFKNSGKKKKVATLATGVLLFLGLTALLFASQITGLKTFSPNQVVTSADMNFNFSTAANAHNELITKVTGMIAFFAGSCPSGWSEYSKAKGRTVLASYLGGTPGNTNTDDFSNSTAQALAFGASKHLVSRVPAHTHAYSGTTGSNGHNHTTGSVQSNGSIPPGSNTVLRSVAGSHNHSLSGLSTSSTSNNGGGGATDSIDATMPYIQLTVCQLNNP